MPESLPVTTKVINAIRSELVVLAPLLFALYEGLSDADWTQPSVWVPVASGIFLRFFVTSPTFKVEERVDEAHDRGFRVGRVVGRSDQV
jgi:hypothetical protein